MPSNRSIGMRIAVPLRPWWWLRSAVMVGAIVLAVTCWTNPAVGLPILWGLVVPALPVLWALAPEIWRNVCPMAGANQLPRALGFMARRRLPGWLERSGYAIGVAAFVSCVALRPTLLETSGPAAALMLLGAIGAALLGGLLFQGKSGFCGSICPLRPTQSVYARAPAVRASHDHCEPCVGCTPNCPDVQPERAFLLELVARGARGESRWLFTGFLPGLTAAFVALPDGTPFLGALVGIVFAGLASLGALAIADATSIAERSTLTAVWGTAAMVTFLWGNIPSTADAVRQLWGVEVGAAALWEARLIAVAFVGAWLGRSLRLIGRERARDAARAAALEALRARTRERQSQRAVSPVPVAAPVALPMAAAPPVAASSTPQGQARAAAVSAGTPGAQEGTLIVTSHGAAAMSAAPAVAGEPPVPVPDRRGPGRADREPAVIFWPSGVAAPVPADDPTVAGAARLVGLPIPVGCGTGLCGCDPVYVRSGAAGLSPAGAQERATLARLGLPANARLACSAVVIGDVSVSLEPAELVEEEPPAPVPTVPASQTPEAIPTPSLVVSPAPAPEPQRIVVIGNGVAGVTAAGHLRRLSPDCHIDLVSRSAHPFYNRIAIARLIHEPQGLGGLQLMPERWYDDQRITQWLNTSVAGVDRAAREVVLGTGQVLGYDRLILATGASWAPLSLPGFELPGVFGLREASDAMHIRAYAQRRRAARAAVIGGGLLGLEVAEALTKLGLDVTVLERSTGVSRHVLDARGSELVQEAVRAAGITVRTRAAVTAIEGDQRVRGVRLVGGELLQADLVICCTGIQPHTELATDAGLAVERGIVVDAAMRTSDPNIFACGDAAAFEGRIAGHWAVGAAQAEVAAVNALGGSRAFRSTPVPTVLKLDALEVLSVGDIRGGDGVRVTAASTNDDRRHQVTYYAGPRPIGLVAINGGPEIDPIVDAVISAAGAADDASREPERRAS